MPIEKVNDMGIQAMVYDSAVSTYNDSRQRKSDRKKIYNELKSVEKRVRKINK